MRDLQDMSALDRSLIYDQLTYDAVQVLLSHGHVYPPRLRYLKETLAHLRRSG